VPSIDMIQENFKASNQEAKGITPQRKSDKS